MTGYVTLPILIIARVLIVVDIAIGMFLLSNKKSILKVTSVSAHTHQEINDE